MLERSGPTLISASRGTGRQELSRFINAIERVAPAGKMVHLILDHRAALQQRGAATRPEAPPIWPDRG
jgi:hypothetical protein